MRDVLIQRKTNGVEVKVGCWELVYTDAQRVQFFKDLGQYLDNPEKTEKRLRKKWGIKDEDVPEGYISTQEEANRVFNIPIVSEDSTENIGSSNTCTTDEGESNE